MARRHRKMTRKYLGLRTHGAGNVKKRRGTGSRGGKGLGGSHKQKWTYMVRYMPDHFGRHGFSSLRREKPKTVNIGDINQMIADGKIEKKNNAYEFQFDGKVLGGGALFFPVNVKARFLTKSAAEKIKAAGGTCEGAVSGEKGEEEKQSGNGQKKNLGKKQEAE